MISLQGISVDRPWTVVGEPKGLGGRRGRSVFPDQPVLLDLFVEVRSGHVDLASCLGDRCPPGYTRQPGTFYCFEDTVDGGALLDADPATSADAAAGDGPAETAASPALQGEPCREKEECAVHVRFCVVMPGELTGYCTKFDCDPAANNCPAGYTCMDVSAYSPGVPTLCLQLD